MDPWWRWHIKFNYVLISRGKCFPLCYILSRCMLKVPLLSMNFSIWAQGFSGFRVFPQCWRAGWLCWRITSAEAMDAGVSEWVLFAESRPASVWLALQTVVHLLQWRLPSSSHRTGFIAVSILELSCYMQKSGLRVSGVSRTESLRSLDKILGNNHTDVTQHIISWFLRHRIMK